VGPQGISRPRATTAPPRTPPARPGAPRQPPATVRPAESPQHNWARAPSSGCWSKASTQAKAKPRETQQHKHQLGAVAASSGITRQGEWHRASTLRPGRSLQSQLAEPDVRSSLARQGIKPARTAAQPMAVRAQQALRPPAQPPRGIKQQGTLAARIGSSTAAHQGLGRGQARACWDTAARRPSPLALACSPRRQPLHTWPPDARLPPGKYLSRLERR